MTNKKIFNTSIIGVLFLSLVLSLAVSPIPPAYAPGCVEAPSGLVNWWDGDSVSGTTASDIISGNDGIMSSGVDIVAGKVGNAFLFDGDDAISIPGEFGGSEITIDAWVKTSGTSKDFQAIVSSTTGELVHLQLFNSGNIVAFVNTGAVVLPIIPQTPTDEYRHIALSIKSGESRLYVDGEVVGKSAKTFDFIIPTKDLHIGSGFGEKRFFHGEIDEIEIYDRALTQAEIQSIFNADSFGKCKGPIPVDIDIKPGSDPNCFNNDGNGVIPVAVLGSNSFDVTQVDTSTIQLEGMAVKVVGKANKLLSSIEDVNGDGFNDLVVKIEDVDGVFTQGSGTATLTGNLLDGTPIEGTDSICITQ